MKNLFFFICFLGWLQSVRSDICTVCNCFFVDLKSVEPGEGPRENAQIISFNYKMETVKPFNSNDSTQIGKYFYVDCSSEENVGQINNLEWPKLEVSGILGNFKRSKWKKLEFFPESIKRQMAVLSLSENLISEMEPFELEDFKNLKMLNLTRNQIEFVPKSTFSKLDLLKILDLSGNSISRIEDWAFYGTSLEYLNLSENSLTQLTPEIFRGLNSLLLLDLSRNALIKLPEEFGSLLPSLEILSLRENNLNKLPDSPGKLKKLDLSSNHLIESPFSHSNLEILDVSDNQLTSLADLHIPKLKVLRAGKNNLTKEVNLDGREIVILDLSHNQFNVIPGDMISDKFDSLEKLYLDGNLIANASFPLQSKPFRNLRLISLSNCFIKILPKNTFQGVFPNNKFNCSDGMGITLNFSNNLINSINKEMFEDFTVCSVDLSNNNLKTLPKTLFPWREMSHVNLQRNPWHCDCNIQWMLDEFMVFMYEHYPRLLFDLRCATPQRYKYKMFVFWYNKTENVFCNSGPSTIYFDLTEAKTIEIWTASAIACIVLGCFIVLTIIAILVLLYKKPKPNKKKPRNAKATHYKLIKQEVASERKQFNENVV